MFFLFQNGTRIWLVLGVGFATTFIVFFSSLSTPVSLMRFSLTDISPNKELEVLSLVFHGFAIPHSAFLEGEIYEFLLEEQRNVTLYYYQVAKGEEGTFGYTVRKEVFPLAKGRLFVLDSINHQEEVYALPFTFSSGSDTWDSVLFWNRISNYYFLYLLRTYQNGDTKVYLFNQDPALQEFPEPEKVNFPFVWNPSLLQFGETLDLPKDFNAVWTHAFTEAYYDLLKLIRFVSNLN